MNKRIRTMRVSPKSKDKPTEYHEINDIQCFKLGDLAILKFYPWPIELQKYKPSTAEICNLVKDREYVKVNTPAGYRNQPRKTVCYGHSYSYSGQNHPVEEETPHFVEQLYNYTEKLFGEPTNMCLLNVYLHGKHSISAHSDDERQMGRFKNVYCWVIGKGARQAIFRRKDKTKCYTILIPEGLYVMSGVNFQKDFTHEFPKMFESAYNRVWKNYLPEDSDADWLWEHREDIKEKLRGTKSYDQFLQWCEPRVSYTLRYFPDEHSKKIKI
jgi:hypothetical protein